MNANLVLDLVGSARRYPESRAMVYDGGETTYNELLTLVSLSARGLTGLGVQNGDRVAYQLSNGPAATILFYAILSIGAVAVPLSPLLSLRETKSARDRTDPRLSIGESEGFGHDLVLDPNTVEVFPEIDRGVSGLDPVVKSVGDASVIFFTSGTTGHPKGVVLSHGNLASNAKWVADRSLDSVGWSESDCSAAVLPLSHIFALTCSQNAAIRSGATISYFSRFDPGRFVERCRRDGITIAAMVPAAAAAMYAAWTDDPGPIPLKYALIGGAPIPSELVRDIEAHMEVTVLEGYGLSETSPVCAFRTPETNRKTGSVGKAAGFADLMIDAGDVGHVDRGEGELLVRGPGVMSHYLDDADNASGFTDGWFRTGDIARLDESGHVFILDRKKDLIIKNGYNISPVEIETVLRSCDAVRDAGIVGIPDDGSGEEVVAFVEPSHADVLPETILDFCKTELARYKVPGRIEMVESIPRGAKGQVLREHLRAQILT